jgi:regulator of RNase E activity RraA
VTAAIGTTQEVVTRLRGLPTAAISDALDHAGIEGAVHGLVPLSDDFRAAGPAFTVRYAPLGGTVGGTVARSVPARCAGSSSRWSTCPITAT